MAQRTLSQTIQDTSNLMERVRREGVTDASGRVLRAPESQAIREINRSAGDPLAFSRQSQETANQIAQTPIQKFNLILMDMLKKYQQLGTGKFREAELAGREQQIRALRETPSSLIGAPPSLQRDVREAEGKVFEPEITGAKQMRQTFQEKLDSFEKILKAAKEYGGEIMKYIKPDEATIKATEAQIRAGSIPSADVMEKVGKYLPTDVWSDWAEANRKGAQAKTDELTKYQELTTLNSIRTAARQDPDIKIFSDVRGSYEQGRAAYQKGITGVAPGVGDIVLMRTIAKITDPTSSVREEEFATFESAQATLAKLGISLTKKMWSGDRLSNSGRNQLFGMLQDIYNQRKSAYDNAWNFYDSQGQELGYSQGNVLPRYYAPENKEIIEKGGRKYKVIPD